MREYREYLTKERAIEEEFRQAVREDKHRGVGKKSPYTVSFFTQVYALWKRQMLLQKNNWFDQVVSYSTAIIIAIIVGSTYLNLPQTAAGGFTRGGLLFIGLLFNALTSFSELPTQMQGRVILFKQQGYTFYRPSALALANVLADIPWSFFRILLFSIILYFMAGLDSSAGAFFTFFINSYILFLAMSALFRVFGTICESYEYVDDQRPREE